MRRIIPAVVCLVIGGSVGIGLISPVLQGQPNIPLTAPKELASYRDVVKHVLPAVVSVEVRLTQVAEAKQPSSQLPQFDNSQIPPEFRKFFEQFQNTPFENPRETPRHGFGSGFLVDPTGVVLTNNHVVKGADQVSVQLQDGRTFVSKDIKTDPKTDLAIIRLQTKTSLPYLELGDSAAMEIGDRVLAVGAPFGLTGSVTAGIISGKGRSPQIATYEDFLQTDAAMNPGNSGGPLVNLEGKVIGINTAIRSSSGGSQGVGLAIPSNLARHIMEQLLKEGVVHRGYLGVQVRMLDPEVAARLGVAAKTGVVVAQVFEGSPAARAGAKAGDVLTTLAGKAITSPQELQRQVIDLPRHKGVPMTVVRDGKSLALEVTIEEQPSTFGQAATAPTTPERAQNGVRFDKVGIEVADLTPKMVKQYGYPAKSTGAVITRVEPGSLAEEAGLKPGGLISKVENTPIHSAAELQDALQHASLTKGILLQMRFPESGVGYVMLKEASGT